MELAPLDVPLREKLLNWCIGGYIAAAIFAYDYEKIVATVPGLRLLFVLAPLCLLGWQMLLFRHRLVQGVETPDLPYYERIKSGDWLRLFWILWIGHGRLVSDYKLGFFLFSILVAFLIGLLVFVASVEYFRKQRVTLLLIGCLTFGYVLLCWEKNAYVTHYGVPILNHFFEKPEYDAKYLVNISLDDPTETMQAVADIHVVRRTEIDDNGSSSHSYTYRDVWVKKLYLLNGETIAVDVQMSPLHVDAPGYVIDSKGRDWYVRLLKESIH